MKKEKRLPKAGFLRGWLLLLAAGLGAAYLQAEEDGSAALDDLPELLESKSGRQVRTAEEWLTVRRPEILGGFEREVYGHAPESGWTLAFQIRKEVEVFNGSATLREVAIEVTRGERSAVINLALFLPLGGDPAPVFLGLNFFGNHTIADCAALSLPMSWVRNSERFDAAGNRAGEGGRGKRAHRWPVRRILERGYGLATVYAGDIDPDKDDSSDGVLALFYESGQERPAADEWGTVTAWAWGLSRVMDYLQQDAAVDGTRVMVMGHSRLGKASLWAGARDERFAMVVSNNSGCGGAALSRRRVGETVAAINERFPHWFAGNFKAYNEREESLPVDQHMLIALMAPRPVYVASATEDDWADPRGEFLSAYLAGEVYRLWDERGLPGPEMPGVDQLLHEGSVGYHVRSGGHDVTAFDWEAWMDFADLRLSATEGR